MMNTEEHAAPRVSIAVRAWNEEKVIRTSLESIFQQSIFEELSQRNERCEVLCVANGCTDKTAEIARAVFAEQKKAHPHAHAFDARVVDIAEAGRNNTWNAFVHAESHREAEFLFIMDSDLVFDRRDTLFNMYATLLGDPHACIASDRQTKDIALKKHKSLFDRLSLATTDMTRTIQGQITGQIYCIRADVARQLYLPKELGAPDDGFIKAIVCTDFFTRELDPSRIVLAENASHVYEAYTSVREVLNNQKRQMIGQTTVYVLVEHLKTLPLKQRMDLAETLRRIEETDPDWSKRLIHEHMRRVRFFWQLFPGALTFRFKRWWKLRGLRKLTHFPAALMGFAVTLLALARAYLHLKKGQTHYWPKAGRDTIRRLDVGGTGGGPVPQPVKN